MEQHWTFKFQTLDDMCFIYWSSVKVVKVMKGLASFNISISELILKYIFSVKMSVHLFTKEKVFKSASWNHLDFTLCSLIGLNSKHFPSESSACQISLAFLLSQGWLRFYIGFFFQYNLVCFDFVQASSSKTLCLILFDSLYSETFDGNFVLCNTLYTGGREVVINCTWLQFPAAHHGWVAQSMVRFNHWLSSIKTNTLSRY